MAGAGVLLVSPLGLQMRIQASLHLRPVWGKERHHTRGDPVNAEHSQSKGLKLEKSQSQGVDFIPSGRMTVGLLCCERLLRDSGDVPDVLNLTRHGGSAWRISNLH